MFAMGPAFFKNVASATLALTGSFAPAVQGAAYSSSIPITGGMEPYSLTGGTGVVSGSLDSGFSLSITGTTGARSLTLSCASPPVAHTMSFTASIGSSDAQTTTSSQNVTVSLPAARYFDPSKLGALLYLANANKTCTQYSSTAWGSAFGLDSAASGYFEVHVDSLSGTPSFLIGLGYAASPTNNYCGSDANGWSYTNTGKYVHNGVAAGAYPALSAGSVVGVATSGGNLWVSVNGTWVTGNPVLGTSPLATGLGASLLPIVSLGNSTSALTLRLTAAEFSYTPPSGFPAWN